VTDQTVLLGKADAPLERRAEAERLARDLARLEAELEELRRAADAASEAAAAARAGVEEARATEGRLAGERHRAEEAERVAARRLETFLREAGWHEAQAGRLAAEADRARAAVESLEAAAATERDAGRGHEPGAAPAEDALSAWEARVAELRSRRDRLRDESTAQDAARRDVEAVHARAAATIALDEERIRRADAEGIALGERERTLRAEQEAVRAERGLAVAREAAARTALDELRAADAADRERLGEAERSAAHARERLRAADERLRAADHAELEARLGLDGLREQLLVELAGLGELGRTRLAAVSGVAPGSAEPDGEDAGGEDEAVDLAALLDAAAPSWEAAPPTDEPPSPGRLATLRRRYHELGAANPYAVAEYAEVKARLDGLETQAGDLRTAITRTRELIDELNTMIADQFRRTFAALETAFEARFVQLFGGGQARLSLTDPADLAATGVEIVARPPGKKAQALAMLSGGERALTAVALLFAMLEVRPVPFCVLDEVDAALDEANIGRFADALRGLADQTQFIVITHNRGTIEAADALYGVTVGDDSVSRVISLRLDEAQALADRRGELAPAG
jgi:chromosome segregation protein